MSPAVRLHLKKLILWVAPLAGLACGGDGGTDIGLPSLRITTATSGVEIDPDGYSVAVDGSAAQTIGLDGNLIVDPLPDGQHTVELAGLAPNCSAPDNPRTVTVSTGVTATVAFAVTCGATSGTIAVTTTTSGAGSDPDGFSLTLDGADRGSIGVNATANLAGITTGAHLVGLTGLAANCQISEDNPRSVTVTQGEAAQVSFAVTCATPAPNSGTLQITTTTGGANLDPDGYSVSVDGGASQPVAVNATLSIVNVSAGQHAVQLLGLAANCTVAEANPRQATVPAGATVTVAFAIACVTPPAGTGGVQITTATTGSSIDPDGYTVTLDGGNAQAITVNGTRTFDNLATGPHSVQLSGVAANCTVAGNNPRAVTIAAGQTATVAFTITCVATGPSVNLSIAGMYLTQSTQTLAGTVPLVADRQGFLRVFAIASGTNTARPSVRVQFFLNGTPTSTQTISPPAQSTPTQVQEGTLGSSWNLPVEAALIRPGLSIEATVDPGNSIPESNENDNGSTKALTVQTVQPVRIRFVSIQQGLQPPGNLSAANMEPARRMYPLNAIDTDVHSDVFSFGGTLAADGTSWFQLLSDLDGLRVSEGTNRTYFGVVNLSYGKPGLVGLTLGQGVPTAVGWDNPTDAGRVVAHELGHTWNQLHTPCGNPPNLDGAYPYGNGIGVYGFDVTAGSLKARTLPDIMGYCDNPWISDYIYKRVLDYREANAAITQAQLAAKQSAILVWGRIENGRPVLEPAFQIVTRPSLPGRPGPYSVSGTAADGSQLFTLSFDVTVAADDPRGNGHFAFAVPLDRARASQLASVRLSGPGGMVTNSRAGASLQTGAPGAPVSTRREGQSVVLQWDASVHPTIMVRDPDTGSILSFARGGNARVWTSKGELDLELSDRVKSQRLRVAISRS